VRLSVALPNFLLQCKPDAEWVPYTIAVRAFSLFAFVPCSSSCIKPNVINKINSTTQHYMIKSKECLNKKLKKKQPTRGKKKRKDQSPNKKPHPKAQNTQWGTLKAEITKPRT